MKRITQLLLLNFLLAVAGINFSSAQTPVLFGTCYMWGTGSGDGTIFQADLDGSNLHTVYSFQGPEGSAPYGKMVQAPNGKIYGVTFFGGCADSCTLFEYNPVSGICLDVYDFVCNPPAGEPSQNGLIILPDGNLYGLQQNGIIYKFNPNTHVYTLLNQSGNVYLGGLLNATDGKLYGASYQGGTNNVGFIFSYDLTAHVYSAPYNLDSIHGAHPFYENLIQAGNGKLYGTTLDGGANNYGVIFSYDLTSKVYNDLHDFDSIQGMNLFGGLIQATDGKLYGMTQAGGNYNDGVIFSYDISASLYTVLHNFDSTDGAQPLRGLTQASNGKLFGTASRGGANDLGVAFSYDIATGMYTKLVDFNYTSGAYPASDIQEMVLPIETGIISSDALPLTIYLDASTQHLIVQNPKFKERARIDVYDARGKNIFKSEIENKKSEFDLSAFSSGIYFVQLKTGEKVDTRKIILSK